MADVDGTAPLPLRNSGLKWLEAVLLTGCIAMVGGLVGGFFLQNVRARFTVGGCYAEER
jgi:hypothetical protein